VGPEHDGFGVRVISVMDRLADRQAGRTEEWTELSGRTPLTIDMRAGTYYAYTFEVVDGEERRGGEQKFRVAQTARDVLVDVPDA
jgi:hypothetical protein